jgi:hypothetical protein
MVNGTKMTATALAGRVDRHTHRDAVHPARRAVAGRDRSGGIAAATAGAGGARSRRRGPYPDFVELYRVMATSLGFEGHMSMADAMT